jgi:hypothetical protein
VRTSVLADATPQSERRLTPVLQRDRRIYGARRNQQPCPYGALRENMEQLSCDFADFSSCRI